MKTFLAIETSCDETAAAVVRGEDGHARVLSSAVSSQIDLHKKTKGVVPEVAARAHVEVINYLIDEALNNAGVARDSIDGVAATITPGLEPALVAGESAGRALAAAWDKPFFAVNHLLGHVGAAFLVSDKQKAARHEFPAIVLLVSGGHTQLYFLSEKLQLKLLGETRDDAAGEAFDKIARLLGLPYPGGAELSKLAEKGDSTKYDFPRPMLNKPDYDFSFSGLKTAVLYRLREEKGNKELSEKYRQDMAASAQEAIVDVLAGKTKKAIEKEGAVEVILAGGVAANKRLREKMKEEIDVPVASPDIEYCTDNAAMIGAAALLELEFIV